jgi:hypothetical protein
MLKGFFNVPTPVNETVLSYAPGSKERSLLKAALQEARSKQIDVPMYIGGKEIRTDKKVAIRPPHDHQHILGYYSQGDKSHVEAAIKSALAAKADWERLPWEQRAAIFLKAADLIAGPYRYKINAATMLGQSKNAFQAEIDAACELIDFLRFNVKYMCEIYEQQPPVSPRGAWKLEDAEKLSAFADYIVPVGLRVMGIFEYAPELEKQINGLVEVERDSPAEIELRASSIYVIAKLTEEINKRRPGMDPLLQPQVDFRFWKTYHATHWPHHLTKTVMY